MGVMEKFCILSVVAERFIKTHKPIHLTWVYFIVYKVYLNTIL